MGTRHVTAVVLDGQYKVAQYGQWDGRPSAAGTDILEFLKVKMDRTLFESKIRALQFNTEEQNKAEWEAVGADPESEWVSFDISDEHRRRYPHNSRDTGAEILDIIQNGITGLGIQDDLSFIADGLFCEWAYVIDLDRNTFEVFEGFNTTPLGNGERFYFMQEADKEYYPCKLAACWSLSSLPTAYGFSVKFSPDEVEGLSGMEPGLSTTTDKEN